MIRYTKKTREILNFIDKYGFITSKICANIFYKNNKYGLTQARDTLNRIAKNGDIVVSSNTKEYGREQIYQFTKKLVSKHDYYILNFYSKVYSLVDKIDEFHLEQHWMGGKRRSDGLIVFTNIVDDVEYKKAYFIECDFTHKTDKEKYIEIYDSGEVQAYFKKVYDNEIFPSVIQIAYSDKASIESNGNFDVIGLDYDCNNLVSKILIA